MPRLRRRSPLGFARAWPIATCGGAIMVLVLLLVVFAPLLTPYSPTANDLAQVRLPPSVTHPLGTDDLGRDLWSRVLYGGRVSIPVALAAVFLAAAIGTAFGLISGFRGGRFDSVLMRLMDS